MFVVRTRVVDTIVSISIQRWTVRVGVAVLVAPAGGEVVDALGGAVLAGFDGVTGQEVTGLKRFLAVEKGEADVERSLVNEIEVGLELVSVDLMCGCAYYLRRNIDARI